MIDQRPSRAAACEFTEIRAAERTDQHPDVIERPLVIGTKRIDRPVEGRTPSFVMPIGSSRGSEYVRRCGERLGPKLLLT